MRLRLALTVLVLALVATVVWVYADQIWGGTGAAPSTTAPGDQGVKTGGETAQTRNKLREQEGDERTRLAGETAGKAAAEPFHTSLRGVFVTPYGVWPGGGRVALFKPPEMPAGGAMGMFSAGMQAGRQKQDKQKPDKQKQTDKAQKLRSLFFPATPVRGTELDAHGGFVLHDPPAGTWLVQIQHPHLIDAGKVEVEIQRGKHIDLGVLPTRLAGSLLVLVADAAGKPVSGAHLELHKKMDMSTFMKPGAAMDILGMIRNMQPRSSMTDSRGAHVFESLSPESSWTLIVSSVHLVDENRPVQVLPGRRSLITVELVTGAELSLSVLDPEGKTRPHVQIKATFPDLQKPETVVGMGVRAGGDAVTKTWFTDSEGRQQVDGLAPGRCVVEVVEVGFLRQKKAVVLTKEEKTELVFKLDLGATVTGQVVDEEGKPVPEARVKHTKTQGFSILGMGFSDILDQVQTLEVQHQGLKVDKDGRFVLGGMEPNEAVQLMAVAPGFDGQKSGRLHAGATGVVIQLRRRARLCGVVHAAESGAVVPDFLVEMQQRSFMVLDVAIVSEEFKGSEDGSFLLEDVPRGRYQVVVTAKGRASWTKNVDFSGGGKVDIGEVRLELPAAVAGVVLDPGGAPVAKAMVRAGKGGQMDSFVLAQVMGQKVVKTDADGRFRLEGLSGAKVRLLVDKEGFAPLRSKPVEVRKGATTEGVVLELSKGGRIKGRLVNSDGQPLEGWIAQATHTSGLGVQTTRTGADGGFVIANLAPGTQKVDCMPGDYMSRFRDRPSSEAMAEGNFNLGKMMTSMMRYVVSERVMVRADEETEVEMVFTEPEEEDATQDLVAVDGRVRVGGRDLEEGILFLFEAGATIQTQLAHVREGVFKLRAAPGHYRVRVQASVFSGTLGQPKSIQIPKAASHTLTLDLPAGRLAGRVVHAEDGTPASGVVLSLESVGDTSLRGDRMDLGEGTQIADSEGRFKFEGLGASTYCLLAKEVRALMGGGGQSGRLDNIQLQESEQRDGLVLQVRKGGRILVRVTDATGPRANALVTLLAADGRPVDLFHRALTEPDGTVTLGGIPAGNYRVNVDAPKAAAKVSDTVEVQSGAEREVTVQLTDGIPAFLELGSKIDNDHASEVLRYSIWRGDGALVRSGRLTVPRNLEAFVRSVGGKLSVGTFEPGRYRLRVEGPRLGKIEVEGEVPDKGTVSFKL